MSHAPMGLGIVIFLLVCVYAACHISCVDGCSGAGAASCVSCKNGYSMDETQGCKGLT